jgi:hypothetical protein
MDNYLFFCRFEYLKIQEMSTVELNGIKLELIGWINQLSDADLIQFLDGLRISRSQNDWWEKLPISHKKQILAGIQYADEGELMDSTKFWENLNNA